MNFATPNADARYFRVYGEGVGEKARQLMLKMQPILDSGFFLDKRNVLGWSFFSGFLKRCGAESAIVAGDLKAARERIAEGKFNDGEMKVFAEICKDFCEHKILAVRSSAEGDALGTGVYDSFFTLNSIENVCEFAKRVLASHFTENAALVRHDAKLDDGIGVMIEPLVANERGELTGYYKDNRGLDMPKTSPVFAPMISGFGRTYSYAAEDAQVGVVQGLAANYVKDPRFGIVITKENAGNGFQDILMDIMMSKKNHAQHHMKGMNKASLALDANANEKVVEFFDNCQTQVLYEEVFADLYGNAVKLHENLGNRAAYFEYATKATEGGRKHFINQIADDARSEFTFEPCKEVSRIAGQAVFVSGGGQKSAAQLVYINHKSGWEKLRQANKEHKNYFLIYEQGASWKGDMDDACTVIGYEHINNAAVIGVNSHEVRKEMMLDFSAHFGGILGLTGKILLGFEYYDQNSLIMEKIRRNAAAKKEYNRGCVVYELPLELLASEKMQYAQIILGQ
ncbi:MAG: PEP/pyruvate-binding domain-containing protein [Candidatus Micrarchaeia archaeon]